MDTLGRTTPVHPEPLRLGAGRLLAKAHARHERREVTVGSQRGVVVREIIEIVSEAARGLPSAQSDPFDDELPGG